MQLYEEGIEEQRKASIAMTTNSVAKLGAHDFEAMFPGLDPALVQMLSADAPSPQVALETLLALAGSMSEPSVPSLASEGLVLEDAAFPSLVGADGWEVANLQQLNHPDEVVGTAWCDRAKAIANKLAPQPAPRTVAKVGIPKKSNSRAAASSPKRSQAEFETDYEYRHRVGKDRIRNRAQFRRGAKATTVSNGGSDDEQDEGLLCDISESVGGDSEQ